MKNIDIRSEWHYPLGRAAIGVYALRSIDMIVIHRQVVPKTLKTAFTASLLKTEHKKECKEKFGKHTPCAFGKVTC